MKIEELLLIMDRLRDPEHGCPWDLRQDFASIAPHTLEEAYEVVDAIEKGDHAHLKNELGDLLFQVVFYARLGKERGLFDFEAIVDEISSKLLFRHPHVFPGGSLDHFAQAGGISAEQVEANWEALKAREREEKGARDEPLSVLDDIALALPALLRARKLQKRAAGVGFDWRDHRGVLDKLGEELEELQDALHGGDDALIEDELGDVLFTLVNLARHLKQDPETALRRANEKFERRFRALEALAAGEGRQLDSLGLDELEGYWQRAKQAEGK